MIYFYVYILKCVDNSYYIGHTDDLEKRIADHQAGLASAYTNNRSPVQLMYAEKFSSRTEAFNAERKLKGWTRFKKELLINYGWERTKKPQIKIEK